MRRRVSLMLSLLAMTAELAGAQNVAPLAAPADRILRFRAELKLDTAQMLKLRDLSRSQNAVLARATSNYLRAEADLLEASRVSDLGVRRAAMEKRSRAAIDGEMLRLTADKEARALLSQAQLDLFEFLLTESGDSGTRARPLWESQVAPLPLAAFPFAAPDSETVRIMTEPLTTEIFVDNQSVGFGRVAIRLPVGPHTLKFRSPTCVQSRPYLVAKGDRSPVAHRMNCTE
jgi:hypothetical protein